MLLFVVVTFLLKLTLLTTSFQTNNLSTLLHPLLSFFLTFSFVALLVIYNLLDWYTALTINIIENPMMVLWFDMAPVNSIINPYVLTLQFLNIYVFPFIYIFVLITTISIIFCLAYNTTEVFSFMFYCWVILLAGYLLFFTESLILFFFAYELLLVPSFFILYNFAKTRRCVEAAYLMFFWTQFGAMFLILSFIYIFLITGTSSFTVLNLTYFSPFELNFLFMCWLVGFGVKLPIWPFYGWLPKAHVEASTNFSIFLSGVLVKFAFFGLLKCLLVVQLEPTCFYIYPFLVVGTLDAVFKLFYQTDLKKLVAYSTVVEMHWLTICVISGHTPLMLASFCMLISHALLSTNSFLLVDAIGRRFKTRLVTEVSGINFICPKLFLVSLLNLLVFLGFPGSIMFIAEILFFSFFFDLFPFLTLLFILCLYFLGPTFFFRTWTNVLFGASAFMYKTLPTDLLLKELLMYLGILVFMFWLGLTWQTFLI